MSYFSCEFALKLLSVVSTENHYLERHKDKLNIGQSGENKC